MTGKLKNLIKAFEGGQLKLEKGLEVGKLYNKVRYLDFFVKERLLNKEELTKVKHSRKTVIEIESSDSFENIDGQSQEKKP